MLFAVPTILVLCRLSFKLYKYGLIMLSVSKYDTKIF